MLTQQFLLLFLKGFIKGGMLLCPGFAALPICPAYPEAHLLSADQNYIWGADTAALQICLLVAFLSDESNA